MPQLSQKNMFRNVEVVMVICVERATERGNKGKINPIKTAQNATNHERQC